MVLSFKDQFIKPIQTGQKIHTIREDKPGRWKPGNKIHFATGVRTAAYNQFKSGECISVQKFKVIYPEIETIIEEEPIVLIDEDIVEDVGVLNRLAFQDGFNSLDEFFRWFNTDFEGKIIHWTDFKY